MRRKVKFPKLEPELYKNIVLNDLLVYALYFLEDQGRGIASEDIISACFRLFPKKFSLKHYPRWPDSAMVSRHWSVCRSKGLIRGTVAEGFTLTYKGTRLAVRVEKKLGLAKPAQVKKVQHPKRTKKRIQKARKPAPLKKPPITKPSKPPVKKRIRKPGTPQPGVHAAPAVKGQHPKRTKRRIEEVRKPASQKKPPVTKPGKPPVKKRIRKPGTPQPGVQAAPTAKVQPRKRTKKRIEEARKPAPQKRPRVTKPGKSPVKKQIRKPGKAQPVVHIAPAAKVQPLKEVVSKEARIKAGKFVHMMERSDAFLQYRKNGRKSRISEFDFRSLLLCTMESSPETLARNLNLFKGYAAIRKRQDLVTFLEFCKESFSSILKPQIKQSTLKVHKQRKW